jgi:signal transduction histidine kinase
MDLADTRRRLHRHSIALAALILLALALLILQFRWTAEVSEAQSIRLTNALNLSLQRVANDLSRELSADVSTLVLRDIPKDRASREAALLKKIDALRGLHPAPGPFRSYGLIVPGHEEVTLFLLDSSTRRFTPRPWPERWQPMRQHVLGHLRPGPAAPPGPSANLPTLFEIPNFRDRAQVPAKSGEPFVSGTMGEIDWLLLEADPEYFRRVVIPRLLAVHLGPDFRERYNFELRVPGSPAAAEVQTPDASVGVFSVDLDSILRDRDAAVAPRTGPNPDRGRWQLLLQHRSGSLQSFAAQSKWRNIALSCTILGLMLITAVVMMRASRRAQELAIMQMNFVASVSHEFRTPLTVIRTAAFNLRGRLAAKPDHVEKYGRLIQEESEKLGEMVEQVLRFASANNGQVIHERRPLDVSALVESGLHASRLALHGPHLEIERNIQPGLPPILADELAIRHVLRNLLDNAAKYGTETSNWIGLQAAAVEQDGAPFIEFRVSDHGPGIPEAEIGKIFNPFFRGQRAVSDQIHGTGLGLNLVQRIVEAHQGSIRVESQPGRGATFIVRLPVAPAELHDEFAHTTS